jgi:hypothetical protein
LLRHIRLAGIDILRHTVKRKPLLLFQLPRIGCLILLLLDRRITLIAAELLSENFILSLELAHRGQKSLSQPRQAIPLLAYQVRLF